jgi:hypothetical protein
LRSAEGFAAEDFAAEGLAAEGLAAEGLASERLAADEWPVGFSSVFVEGIVDDGLGIDERRLSIFDFRFLIGDF